MRWVSASIDNGTCEEVAEVPTEWVTASAGNGACVEVSPCACGDGTVLIRDSKDPGGPVLKFTAEEWRVFAQGVRDGVFDQIGTS